MVDHLVHIYHEGVSEQKTFVHPIHAYLKSRILNVVLYDSYQFLKIKDTKNKKKSKIDAYGLKNYEKKQQQQQSGGPK
jgi:ABC-type nitrate/sulfonate/bicarbonate transport system ATPase subunit